jgi:hypothetical protein
MLLARTILLLQTAKDCCGLLFRQKKNVEILLLGIYENKIYEGSVGVNLNFDRGNLKFL